MKTLNTSLIFILSFFCFSSYSSTMQGLECSSNGVVLNFDNGKERVPFEDGVLSVGRSNLEISFYEDLKLGGNRAEDGIFYNAKRSGGKLTGYTVVAVYRFENEVSVDLGFISTDSRHSKAEIARKVDAGNFLLNQEVRFSNCPR